MSVFLDGKGAYPNSKIDFDNSANPRCTTHADGSVYTKAPYGGPAIRTAAPKQPETIVSPYTNRDAYPPRDYSTAGQSLADIAALKPKI